MVRASGESIGTGGGGRLENGTYHLLITHAEECKSTTSASVGIMVELEVLAGTVHGMAGKTLKYQRFWNGRMFNLAAAAGLVDHITGEIFTPTKLAAFEKMQKENEEAKEAGKPMPHAIPDGDFDPAEAIGRTVIGEVKRPAATKEKPDPFAEVNPFTLKSPFDPSVKDVPKDAQYLGEVGAAASAPSGDAAFD